MNPSSTPDSTPLPTAPSASPLPLAGRRGLILGVANEHSIAWGCAQMARAQGASLVLGMEREHRARVVALAPALLRRTFTLREFERLAAHFDDEALARAVDSPFVTADPESRLTAVLGLLSDARGMTPPPGPV